MTRKTRKTLPTGETAIRVPMSDLDAYVNNLIARHPVEVSNMMRLVNASRAAGKPVAEMTPAEMAAHGIADLADCGRPTPRPAARPRKGDRRDL